MNTVVFDIETNAIKNFDTLLGLKEIHCIALSTNGEDARLVPVEEALEELRLADVIVGHNIQNFDIRAIKRLYPDWQPEGLVRDTLVMCRMLWPDIQNEDWQSPDFPRKLSGRHSLKAWGYRLGMLKGDFGETCDWSVYTDEMGEYCVQDVNVTAALWKKIEAENPPDHPTGVEHEFAAILSQQEKNGFAFDGNEARKLHSSLLVIKDDIEKELQSVFPPQVQVMKTPVDYLDPLTNERYKKKGQAPLDIRKRLINGDLRTKEIPFNPGSRKQIADAFKDRYNWKPKSFTPDGRPKMNEQVLSGLRFPEAKLMSRYLTVIKRLGQISDGREAWLKAEKDGRIHGRINPCGAVTSRCTHSRPNMAQVPRVGAEWGTECRALFIAPPGYSLVGVDASGLELRCLAHYTHPFDKGRYTKEILEGDIHTTNQKAAGLENRDQAKTFIYALCYGAGDEKIGSITGGGRSAGKRLKSQFYAKIPALKKIQDGVGHRLKTQTYLTGIDGRKLNIRSKHSALNTLLQSAGAIAMKEATCILHRKIRSQGWGPSDVQQVGHIHDEIQLQVRTDISDELGRMAVRSIIEAGEALGFRCPLDGEYKVGSNWAETH